jgi:signal transduction histidine kinase
MKAVQQSMPSDTRAANGAAPLYVFPTPNPTPPLFCSLVARALQCRRCSLLLRGADGELAVAEAAGEPLNAAEAPVVVVLAEADAEAGRKRQRRGAAAAAAVLSAPLVLADGATGLIAVAEREDGTDFGPEHVALLESFAAYYATTQDAQARREIMRLKSETRALRARAIQAEERQRQRLARELHDDIGHALTTAILGLDMQAQGLPVDEDSRAVLMSARETLAECAEHLHEFAFHLRPRVLADLGLVAALRGLVRRVQETGGIQASLKVNGKEHRLGDDTDLAAFRIVQEALTNVLKYAHSPRVSVEVTFSRHGLDIEVTDNGIGFKCDVPVRRATGGNGLAGMRERAELVGGALEIDSLRGRGTTIWARLPNGEELHG